MKVTEQMIQSLSPNEQALKNGKELVKKDRFVRYEKSKDDTFYCGECIGSGKDNYLVSIDFVNEAKPVFRCSCPSRQFPCKHGIGLLYAISAGKKFKDGEIPADILKKRENLEKKAERKLTEPKEKKVNIDALLKKIDTQLEGLSVLEKMLSDITVYGLGTLNIKQVRIYEEQAKKLGDYYISGLQSRFRDFLYCFMKNQNDINYDEALIKLSDLNYLLLKGRQYLLKKKEDPLVNIDSNSSIEEALGSVWQLSQLKDLGLVKENVHIVQLSFSEINDEANNQNIDQGIWICLEDGQIYQSLNYRPYKAAKYIKEEDSCFFVLSLKEMYLYPQECNNRIRYEEYSDRPLNADDLRRILSFGKENYSDTVKQVKNIIKSPLSNRMVFSLLRFAEIGKVESQMVIENSNQERIVLSGEYCENINFLSKKILHNGAVLGKFENNFSKGILEFQPLTIINEKQIIRLAF